LQISAVRCVADGGVGEIKRGVRCSKIFYYNYPALNSELMRIAIVRSGSKN
jgi:hypothetical protein